MASSPTAAIFDLDRTLISGSSSTVFMRHLTEAGVADIASNPVLEPIVAVAQFAIKTTYDLIGESRLLMQPAKLAVRVSSGWSMADAEAASPPAAPDTFHLVHPFPRPLIHSSHAPGRILFPLPPTLLPQP